MRLLFTLWGLVLILSVNAQKITRKEAVKQQLLTEAANFRIDSVIFYCNPYITNYFEPIEKDYEPKWLQASLVNNRPDLFDKYASTALKFSHSSMIQDSTKIEEFKKLRVESLKQTKALNKNRPLYCYALGEIWFTELEKNVNMVAVSLLYKHDSIPMNINLLTDSLSVNGTGAELFLWDDNILKNFGYEFYEQLELANYKFWALKDFKKILTIIPFYKRSYILNGHRIFETVKNTPNGLVVIGINGDSIGSQTWYLKYWWVLAVGLVVALLAVFIYWKFRK